MTREDDAVDFDIVITRRPEPERKWFQCVICKEAVEIPPEGYLWRAKQKPPLCLGCIRHWGSRNSGPVFNRQNYRTLQELSAIINKLQWEIINGRYGKHRRGV